MTDESEATLQSPKKMPSPMEESMSDEELIKRAFEQARQDVKLIVKKEREGEKIDPELLNFRMRQPDGK